MDALWKFIDECFEIIHSVIGNLVIPIIPIIALPLSGNMSLIGKRFEPLTKIAIINSD
ncbi:hypothetical protein D3C84_1284860 [compost metagenome]